MDEQGRYVSVLDRSAFAEEDQVFSLKLTAQLTDGSFQTLSDYTFEWKKDVVSAAEKPTALDNSDATPSKIEEEATSTTTSSTVNSSLTAGTTSSTSNSLTRSSSNTIAGSSNGSTSVPSARVSTASKVSGTITVTNVNASSGTFDVIISNVVGSSSVQTVLVPIWSDINGQDDLRWYSATRQSNGTYKVSVNKKDHKDSTGQYHIHLYYQYSSGRGPIVDAIPFNLPVVQVQGKLQVQNVNASSGTFDVIISNVVGSSSVQTVLVPIWSDINGQDDLRWYSATRQSNGTYKVSVNKKDHKDSTGQYHIHLYYQYSSGRGPIVDAIPFNLPAAQVQGKLQVQNVNASSGTFDVIISNVVGSSSVQTVLVPIWSDINGQDDLRWYSATRQSNGTYKVSVNKKDHKDSTGQYHIHLYYQYSSGRGPIVDAIPFNLPAAQVQGKLQVQNVNAASGTFDVVISNVVGSSNVQTVLVPIWSDINGQDDLRWYSATRQSNGTYKVSVNKKDHKDSTGQYHIHLYYQYSSGRGPIVDAIPFNLPAAQVQGKLQVQNVNAASGTFDVIISNVVGSSSVQTVLVPIWSDINGQDDLRWYSATRQPNGTYKLSVNKKDHKDSTGQYHIHLYYQYSSGRGPIVDAIPFNLPAAQVQGKLQVQNVNASSGTFDVIISNVVGSSSVQTVLVPIWSDINGQDDLRWYSATRQSNGTYKVSVNKKDHKDSTGQYHIHLYYQYSSGRGPIVDGILFELPRVSNSPIVQIQNIDSDLGSFEVNISQVAMVSQDQKILVPIWSDINGQDDLRWYSATRQSDGTYKVSVNKKDHKYSIGKYHIHVYYDSYGSKNIVATTTVNLPSSRSYTVYIDPGHGGRDSGASYGGVHEKNLALSVANKLRDNLVQRGINVLMTRDGDYDVDFKTERSRMTNESNADLFISIHFNATGAGVSNSSGIETYWYQYDPEYQPKINKEMHNNPTRLAESEILANKVQESLIKETGAVNRGVRRETFAVLRETAIPAILVELGFMDNPSELQVIKQDSYHTRLAKALAQGVMNWYGAVEGK
ncbi:GBS Bsp-like repeat-containing protein [Streptococcus suis]|nr:GBS Bsp-like repeat-containing protein [Streptococcus suis]QZS61971.1 GBS Bsp-like repeat-containing protein [Streptococcus suis]